MGDERGVGGDFRNGPAKDDFLAISEVFHFDRSCAKDIPAPDSPDEGMI
jgi:hypothetical protein